MAESFYMQYMTGFFVAIATQNDAGAESRETTLLRRVLQAYGTECPSRRA